MARIRTHNSTHFVILLHINSQNGKYFAAAMEMDNNKRNAFRDVVHNTLYARANLFAIASSSGCQSHLLRLPMRCTAASPFSFSLYNGKIINAPDCALQPFFLSRAGKEGMKSAAFSSERRHTDTHTQ